MLARTYFTAEALGVTEAELSALAWVQEILESGGIGPSSRVSRDVMADVVAETSRALCMSFTKCYTNCGTAACVGGWVAHRLSVNDYNYVNFRRSPALVDLYWSYPRGRDVSPAEAARAVDRFRRGLAPWSNA